MRVGILVLLILSSCRGSPEPAVELTLEVQGMTCGSCEQAIRTEVGRLPGVRAVRASHRDKRAWVTFERGRVTTRTIIETINRLGYRASSLRTAPKKPAKER